MSAASMPMDSGFPEEEKEFLKDITEKLKGIKTHLTKKGRIDNAINKCQNFGQKVREMRPIEKTRQATTAVAVKTYNGTAIAMTKFPMFFTFLAGVILYIYEIFKYTSSGVDFTFKFIKTQVSWFTIPTWTESWYPTMIIIMIILAILVELFPGGKIETKHKFISKEFTWFMAITAIILLLGAVTTADATPEESLIAAGDQAIESTTSFWEDFMCRTINYQECWVPKQNEKKSESVDSQEFAISLEPIEPLFSHEYLKDDKIFLTYDILSEGGALTLNRLECFLTKEEGEPFSVQDLANKEINHNIIKPETGFYCDTSKIDWTRINSEQFEIKAILYYTAKTELSQVIPFFKADSQEDIDDYESNMMLNRGKTSSTNEALELTVTTPNTKLPIYYGENIELEDEYRFDFVIEKIRDNKIGEMKTTTITETIIPDKALSLTKTAPVLNNGPTQIPTKDDKARFMFSLKPNPEKFKGNYFTETIAFKLESQFKKTSTIRIILSDYDEALDNGAFEEPTYTQDEPIVTEVTY